MIMSLQKRLVARDIISWKNIAAIIQLTGQLADQPFG